MKQTQLSNRSLIRLGGTDNRVFLQGLISNDVNLCDDQTAIYAALLTPQGKFLHDLFVIGDGADLLIDCEAARSADLLANLQRRKLRSDIVLVNAADDFNVWAIWDGAPTVKSFADPRLPALGHRAILKKSAAPNGETAPYSAYDYHRLSLGIADGTRDMVMEKSTLLEGNFDKFNGISWTKGCYMGQELTARTHYRGLVKKRLAPVRFTGSAPEPGSLVIQDGVEVGEMRSSCESIGLALLKIDLPENAALTCGTTPLTLRKVAA